MNIRLFVSFFIFLLVLQPVTGRAFIPQTPHLLHLVVQHIMQPVGLEAVQIKTISNCDFADIQEEVWLDERLMYQFPNQLKVETATLAGTDFTIESDFSFIKVVNGQVVAKEKSPIDLYTDILLYRDYEILLGQLALAGIDVSSVTLQRYDGRICYVIGRSGRNGAAFPGLWIEKDTFFPVKYVVEKDGWMVETLYSNWQKISRTYYPMAVSISLDNQLFAKVAVSQVSLRSNFSTALFNISLVERQYPPKKEAEVFNESDQEVNEVQKRIEEFKKLYE
jgi:hypothetical protein